LIVLTSLILLKSRHPIVQSFPKFLFIFLTHLKTLIFHKILHQIFVCTRSSNLSVFLKCDITKHFRRMAELDLYGVDSYLAAD
jgi:hypothetical protein